jgi:hypothetical protein
VSLLARFGGVEQRIECGHASWTKGRMAYGPMSEQPAAVSGAWTADDTYTAKICFYETPFILTLSLKYHGDELLFDSQSHVGFGSANHQQLVGKAAQN